jgi:hypothetical protein
MLETCVIMNAVPSGQSSKRICRTCASFSRCQDNLSPPTWLSRLVQILLFVLRMESCRETRGTVRYLVPVYPGSKWREISCICHVPVRIRELQRSYLLVSYFVLLECSTNNYHSYELQVLSSSQRAGLGRLLLRSLENIGTTLRMDKLILTVLKGQSFILRVRVFLL